jgi:hypothetical protein
MADPALIVKDPDFLAASPQMKARILATHDPDFAAASPEMQARIVERFGAGQRTGLISGADKTDALAQTDPKAATISPPPGALDYARAGLEQAVETVLPTAGLLGGAALGTAAGGPVGGVGGAGLGYATGQEANRTIGTVWNYLTGKPVESPTLVERGVRTGQDVVTGSILDMLPPALLGALRSGKDLAKGALGLGAPTAETVAVREAATRQGIELPAGAASGSTPVSTIESIPGRFPIGRQTSEPTYNRVQLQSQRAAERLRQHPEMGAVGMEQAGLAVKREVGDIARAQENAPTELVDRFAQTLGRRANSRIEAGQQLREGMQGSQRAVRAQADELYRAARAEAPPDATLIPERANRVATEIATLESRLGALGNRSRGPAQTVRDLSAPRETVSIEGQEMPVSSLPQQFVRQHGLDQPTPIPLDLAIELAKRAKALMRATTNDVEKGQLRTIANALSEDIGALTPGLQRAGQFYRDEVARDFAPKSFIRKLIDMEPGRIAENVLTAQPDKIAAIMRQTPNAQRPMVQRMVFDKLRERSIDPRTGEIDPAKFESALQAFGDDNLRVVFGHRVNDLAAIRQTMRANFGRQAEVQEPGFAGVAGNPFDVPLQGNAEGVVNALTLGKVKSLADFDAVYRTVSPDTQRMIRASVYDNVVRQSFDNTGRFSIERFMTAKNRVPQDVWDRMLTTDTRAALADLQMVFGRLATHARAASNPSQTSTAILGPSQVLGGMALAGSTAVGNEDFESFSTKLLGLMSPALLGKAVFSGPGQRMLTSQPSPPFDPQNPLATLGKVLGVQLVPRGGRE